MAFIKSVKLCKIRNIIFWFCYSLQLPNGFPLPQQQVAEKQQQQTLEMPPKVQQGLKHAKKVKEFSRGLFSNADIAKTLTCSFQSVFFTRPTFLAEEH